MGLVRSAQRSLIGSLGTTFSTNRRYFTKYRTRQKCPLAVMMVKTCQP